MKPYNGRILLLTTYYPPVPSVATNRMVSFAKYLTQAGFEVEVITITHDLGCAKMTIEDGVKIIRAYEGFPFLPLTFHQKTSLIKHKFKAGINRLLPYFFSLYSRWERDVFTLACQQHTEKNYDLIISSFAPESPHKVALRLKREYPELKWIADMRDEFAANSGLSGRKLRERKQLEQRVLSECDLLTSVSQPILDLFSAEKPGLKVQLIRNGFDFDVEVRPVVKARQKFTIGYAGSFYGIISPTLFMQAMSELVAENHDFARCIKIKFLGVTKSINIPDNLRSSVDILPKVSYDESIEFIRLCDAGLLILPASQRKGVYSGKIFDYIGAQTPIFGVLDKSDVAAELITELQCGYIADSQSVMDIKKMMIIMYEDWKSGRLRKASSDDALGCHRQHEVAKLVATCHGIIQHA